MKIGFVTDTCILDNTKMLEVKSIFGKMDILINYISSNKKTRNHKDLIYYMPEIVAEELIEHFKESFDENYNELRKNYDLLSFALNGKLPNVDINRVVEKEKKKYFSKVTILKLNYTDKLFNKLVDDAINKNYPFNKEKEGKKTDAGFKDALIWNIVLNSEEIDECNKFYYITGDKIFDNNQYLIDEFKMYHPNVNLEILYHETNGKQIIEPLQKIIKDNDLKETEVIALYDEELIMEMIKSIDFDYHKSVFYVNDMKRYKLKTIYFRDFNYEDFTIDNVKKNNDNYLVSIKLDTKKYDFEEETDSNEKVNISGLINLNVSKNKKLNKFEIVELKFNNNNEVEYLINQVKQLSESNDNYKEFLDRLIKLKLFDMIISKKNSIVSNK